MSARLLPLSEVDGALVEAWRSLGREALEPNPFAEADFVLPAGRWVESGERAAVVVVERDGELRFVLPVIRTHHFRHIPVPAVTTWTHAYAFLGTPLLSPRDPEEVWGEALAVMRELAPWGVLEQLSSDGSVAAALSAAQARRRRALTILTRPDRPVLCRRVDGSYLDLLSGSRRRKMRRLRPRLEADSDGDVRVVDHGTSGDALERAVDDFLAMESASWKGVDGGAIARNAGHAEFFREVCRGFASTGSLQLRALQVGSRTIAYQCNLLAGDTVFGFKTTFDAAFRRYSPGVVLVIHTISALHADDRLDIYDSCLDTKVTPFRDLFPDRRGLADALVSLSGPLGTAATRLTPRAAAVYRRAGEVRRSVEDRFRPRPAGRS